MIGFSRASKRRTESYWVTIFGVDILISYQTPVAFTNNNGVMFRRKNIWGPTTGRHLHEANASEWTTVDELEFARELRAAIARRASRDAEFIAALVTHKLVPERTEHAEEVLA